MKETHVIINNKIVEIVSKGIWLFTNSYNMSYASCIVLSIISIAELIMYNCEPAYATAYKVYAVLATLFLIILIRAPYLYFKYKKNTAKLLENKEAVDYRVYFKESNLVIENKEKKIKLKYEDIKFIGKISTFYFIYFQENEKYKLSPVANSVRDDNLINDLLVKCPNLKINKVLSYETARNSAILLFIVFLFMLISNVIQLILVS